MAFDFFSQPVGPDIKVSLFGDSYSQGVRAGQSVPSTFGAIAQGISGGIDAYTSTAQQFQNLETGEIQQETARVNQESSRIAQETARLNQERLAQENAVLPEKLDLGLDQQRASIDATRAGQETTQLEQIRLRQQNEILPEQQALLLERQRAEAEVAQLKLDAAQRAEEIATNNAKTEALRQQNTAKALAEKSQNDLYLTETQNKITTQLSSPLPQERVAVITDPTNAGYYLQNPKAFEQAYKQVENLIPPEERPKYQRMISSAMTQSAMDAIKKEERVRQQKMADSYTQTFNDVKANPRLRVLTRGLSDQEIAEGFQVFPQGQKKTKQVGKDLLMDPEAPDGKPDELSSTMYDVFDRKGKYVTSLLGENEKDPASLLTAAQEAFDSKFALEGGTRTEPAPEPEPTPTPQTIKGGGEPRKVRTLDDILASMRTSAVPTQTQSAASEVISNAYRRGATENFIDEAVASIVPLAAIKLPGALGDIATSLNPAMSDARKLNEIVDNAAEVTTQQIMEKASNGTPEEKKQISDWALKQGLRLNPSEIRSYYRDTLAGTLQRDYAEAIASGKYDKQAGVRREIAGEVATAGREGLGERRSRAAAAQAEMIRQQRNPELEVTAADVAPTENLSSSPGVEGLSSLEADAMDVMKGMEARASYPTEQTAMAAPASQEPQEPSRARVYGTEEPTPGPVPMPTFAATVDERLSQMRVTPAEAAQIKRTATRVQENELLASQPPLIKAMAAQESAGNNNAISPTGVRGVMQVTKAVANSFGLNRDIPEENLEAGMMYIRQLMRQFNNDEELALAAYNAGPGTVTEAIRRSGLDKGVATWADIKPFMREALKKYERQIGVPADKKYQEVRNYPEKILRYKQVFV